MYGTLSKYKNPQAQKLVTWGLGYKAKNQLRPGGGAGTN
jgi:hypothetical protein